MSRGSVGKLLEIHRVLCALAVIALVANLCACHSKKTVKEGAPPGRIEYFCPSSNGVVLIEGKDIQVVREPPLVKTARGTDMYRKHWSLSIKECSDAKYHCQAWIDADSGRESIAIYLPKNMDILNRYALGNSVLTTYYTSVEGEFGSVIQALLIENGSSGSTRRMLMTLEKGRGLVYIDGLGELIGDEHIGSCVLRSPKGLFSVAEWVIPKNPPETRY